MNVIICSAAASQHAAICNLIAQLAQEEHCTSVLTVDALRAQIACAAPPLSLYVALQDKEVIGCVIAYIGYDVQSASRGWHISDLFVLPRHRRCGIARRLLGALASEGLADGFKWMSWTVMQNNTGGIAFYESLGAEIVDVSFMAIGKQGMQALHS